MSKLFRSLFFVPGNNPRFLEKAKTIHADIACFDLEDSVPDDQKAAARGMVQDALKSRAQYGSSVYVRINSSESGLIPADLDAVMRDGIDGIVMPKVGGCPEMARAEDMIRALEASRGLGRTMIMPSIESALGVVNCYGIASHSDRIAAVVFGVFDLLHDMNIEYAKGAPGAAYARAKVALDSRAARVPAIDAIWQDLQDETGLEADCAAGKSLGYAGKSVIHPSQIDAVHRIFRPNASDVSWAKKVCAEYEEAAGSGRGAALADGRMIDEVHYKMAKAVLDLANG